MSNGALSMDEIMDLLNGVDMAAKGAAQNSSAASDASGKAGSGTSGGTSVLSLNEIDTLLKAVNAGKATDGNDTFDYSERPNKFSKNHLREISIIHEKFALMAIKSLSDQIHSKVDLRVAAVDQIFLDEFNRCIPVPSVLAVVNMEPLKGNAIIEIDPSMTSAIINKIGGGNGEQHKQWYELTGIQKKIIEGIFDCLLATLQEAWSEVIDISPKLIKIEPDPKFIRGYPPTEWVLLIVMEAKVLDAESMINICIPYPVIEPILEKLSC